MTIQKIKMGEWSMEEKRKLVNKVNKVNINSYPKFDKNFKVEQELKKIVGTYSKNNCQKNVKFSQTIIEGFIGALGNANSKEEIKRLDSLLYKMQVEIGGGFNGCLLYDYIPVKESEVRLLAQCPKVARLIRENMMECLDENNENFLISDVFPIDFCFEGFATRLERLHPEVQIVTNKLMQKIGFGLDVRLLGEEQVQRF